MNLKPSRGSDSCWNQIPPTASPQFCPRSDAAVTLPDRSSNSVGTPLNIRSPLVRFAAANRLRPTRALCCCCSCPPRRGGAPGQQPRPAPADSRPRLACHTPDLCVSLRGFAASRETIQPAEFPNRTDATAQCSSWKARAKENKTAAGAIQTDFAAARQASSHAMHPQTPVRGSPATHRNCAFPFAASRLRVSP
jgi:hypothetical protein